MSAIWGSLQLFSAKNSREVNDGSITFGQVLPVALLIAPLLSLVVAGAQLYRDASLNPPDSGWGLDEHRAGPADVHSQFEQTGSPLGRESQPQWLTQNYYGESWMMPTLVMAIGQILYLTTTIFRFMASNVSASKTLVSMLLWIFLVQPASCFFVILLGLAVGTHGPHRQSRCHLSPTSLSYVYWVCAVIIFVSYSLSPVWLGDYSPSRLEDAAVSNFTFMYIQVPVAFGIMLLYCIVCCLVIRSPAAGDEEEMELNTY